MTAQNHTGGAEPRRAGHGGAGRVGELELALVDGENGRVSRSAWREVEITSRRSRTPMGTLRGRVLDETGAVTSAPQPVPRRVRTTAWAHGSRASSPHG